MSGSQRGGVPPAQAPPSSGPGLYVRFKLKKAETKWGQNLALVGNSSALSSWKADRSTVRLKTNKQMYPVWESSELVRLSSK